MAVVMVVAASGRLTRWNSITYAMALTFFSCFAISGCVHPGFEAPASTSIPSTVPRHDDEGFDARREWLTSALARKRVVIIHVYARWDSSAYRGMPLIFGSNEFKCFIAESANTFGLVTVDATSPKDLSHALKEFPLDSLPATIFFDVGAAEFVGTIGGTIDQSVILQLASIAAGPGSPMARRESIESRWRAFVAEQRRLP